MAALRSPLVGRARELNHLNGLLDETLETATPHFVLVYGPAGIGKSRLIVEFLAGARARSDSTCSPAAAEQPVADHVLGPSRRFFAGLRDRASTTRRTWQPRTCSVRLRSARGARAA